MTDAYTSPAGADIDPSPVSYIARVTFDAKIDIKTIKMARRLDQTRRLYSDGDVMAEGTWDYMNPELAVMKNVEEREMNGYKAGREALVISSLTAVRFIEGPTVEEAMARYELAGIVQGSVKVHKEQPATPGVSITCGGLLSIVNTGITSIRAGDLLYWDFPKVVGGTGPDKNNVDHNDYTAPPYYKTNKIPVVVRRFKFLDIAQRIPGTVHSFIKAGGLTGGVKANDVNGGNLIDELEAFILMAESVFTAAKAAKQGATARDVSLAILSESVYTAGGARIDTFSLSNENRIVRDKFLSSLMRLHNAVKNRVFARAVSNAAPGVKVDIVWGNYRH